MEEKNSPIIFCEWLKRRRKALDMTQDELARRAGCSIGALRKIESGDRRPSKQLAGLLAKALDIPIENQQTFIRVARGELNLERLGSPSLATSPSIADISISQKGQQRIETRSRLPPNRIPLQATPLIGRELELAAIDRIFADPQCRLLTLTGVGGIGKTRLAIEYATRCASEFPGGVFYIPLTPVNTPEEIVPAIADVLDFVFSGPSDPKEQLLTYISGSIRQQVLFVLDNLEQLLIHAPTGDVESGLVELVSEILQRMPHGSILGTSRERLNMHGEWTYELHGLSVPPLNFVDRLEDYDSVSLFIKSAQRVKADFHIPVEDQFPLVRICQLIEGVPLAIELAAAWVGLLSCEEIAQEIQASMDFLTSSMRNIPERHRSIRATFDHSWRLLSDEERLALCQLSVFQGGFDRYAAQEIAEASLPLLASLCAKSLVRRLESGRYDLHEVIRQYSMAHLNDHPNSLGTFERHCQYYLNFVFEREKALKSAPQQDAIRQLTDEIDNIRTAWSWAINHEEFDQLGRAGRAYGWYFEIAGLYDEGIEQLELLVQALKASPNAGDWQRALGLALVHQALLYFRKGEFDRAQKLYQESIVTLRPVGDQALLADALIFLGILHHLSGDYMQAISLVEEGRDFARESGDRWFEAYAFCNLGYIDSLLGRYTAGYEQMKAGLAAWRQLGDPHYIALGLNFMVPTLIKLGRYQEAKAFMQESIALCEGSKNRWGMGTAYRYLGLACIAGGQYAEAQAHLLKSLEIFGGFSIGWDIARSLTYLGDAARLAGDGAEAREYYLDALRTSIEAKAIPITLDVLTGLGCLLEGSGKAEDALLLSRYVLDHPASEGETKDRAGELAAALEAKLTAEQVAARRRKAAGATLDEVVNLALGGGADAMPFFGF